MGQFTRTAKALDTDDNDSPEIDFTLRVERKNSEKAIAVAVANGRETPNRRDRLFVKVSIPYEETDGSNGRKVTQWLHVDRTRYSNLTTAQLNGFFATIIEVYKVEKTDQGLD